MYLMNGLYCLHERTVGTNQEEQNDVNDGKLTSDTLEDTRKLVNELGAKLTGIDQYIYYIIK